MITTKYLTSIISKLESSSEKYCAKSQKRILKSNGSFRPDHTLIDASYLVISLSSGIAAKTIQKISKPLYNLEDSLK